jgi:imidazole glycerol-phosphate synthase subunit HisH
MSTVAIVDYGMCNLDSVSRAVEECGGRSMITDQAGEIDRADRIILPGVGAFPDAMHNIKKRSLDKILAEQVFEKNIPLLGICLGMQLLATVGFECQETEGLGWIPGRVIRLESYGEDSRIPHIGWNEVYPVRPSSLFDGIEDGKDFYFVHSYHFCPDHEDHILARTPYSRGFVSGIQRDKIFGLQFHPEKSQRIGFKIIKNFLSI